MGREYSVNFTDVVVSAAQDLFELLVGADQCMILHELHITQSSDAGDAQSEQFAVAIKRVTGSPTSGSGGSTMIPKPLDVGDAAASITAEINNTTQLTGGVPVMLHKEASNVMAGLHYVPTPNARPVFRGQTRCVISLGAAPTDALTMSGVAIVEEIG